ncbi:UNVERIFIED_CONTAM: Meiosis regulator and mRNA stability factor 1 [Gekko kuhli]
MFTLVFTNDEAEYVRLKDLYVFAKKVRYLLHTYHYQQIFLHEFSTAYTKYTGEMLHPKAYGYNSLEELLGAIPSVVWIKGHGHKRIVVLKNDMKTRFSSPGLPLTDENYGNQLADHDGQITDVPNLRKSLELKVEAPNTVSNHTEQELLCLTNTSPIDLLCEPVPSCLPSPQLRPDPVLLESVDLIQFEEHPSSLSGMVTLTEDIEKAVGPLEVKEELSHIPLAPDAAEIPSASPCPLAETSKEAMDSPAKKQHKNRVKLAANFSLAPVTKL